MVKILDLWKIYGTGEAQVEALRGINLSVEKGEFLALAGASGSGKTTLLNMIGCLDNFTKGDLFVNNVNVKEFSLDQKTDFRRNNLGFIFQSYNLIPVLTVFENVAFPLNLLKLPKEEVKQRVEALLDEVGILNKKDKRPSQLSGGQQQRVAIARALAKSPSLVLADEPTANLDSKIGEEILKLMKDLNEKKGVTFIFSTHDNMVMDYAKRIVRIHDGQITADERK